LSRASFRFSHRQQIGLVFLCTIFGVAAQYFLKTSASSLQSGQLLSAIGSVSLWAGLVLYGINTGLLILALRDGELSLLYPVISLTYVWVTIMSVTLLGESMDKTKVAGIALICMGVAFLGRKEDK
jgi:multidrug transporter EmrE-like cation transporter